MALNPPIKRPNITTLRGASPSYLCPVWTGAWTGDLWCTARADCPPGRGPRFLRGGRCSEWPPLSGERRPDCRASIGRVRWAIPTPQRQRPGACCYCWPWREKCQENTNLLAWGSVISETPRVGGLLVKTKPDPHTQRTSFLLIPLIYPSGCEDMPLFVINHKTRLLPRAKTKTNEILHGAAAELTSGQGDTFYEGPSSWHGQAEHEVTFLAKLSLL